VTPVFGTHRPGIGDPLVWPVPVVEVPGLAQGVEQVLLVPDQGLVEQLAAAGQHPVLCQNPRMGTDLAFRAR
jgi:hypothetical protein